MLLPLGHGCWPPMLQPFPMHPPLEILGPCWPPASTMPPDAGGPREDMVSPRPLSQPSRGGLEGGMEIIFHFRLHVRLMGVLQRAPMYLALRVWGTDRSAAMLFVSCTCARESLSWALCGAACRRSVCRKVIREEQQRPLRRTSLQKRLRSSCQLPKLKLCSSQKCLFRLTSKRKL